MACATFKRRLNLESLHSPESENTKRRRQTVVSAGGVSPGTVTQDMGVASSPSLTQDQVSTHIQHELKRLNRNRQLNSDDFNGLDAWKFQKLSGGDGSLEGYPNVFQNQDDKPIFTLQDVEMICEHNLREREKHLQEMYGQALKVQMAEQYDVFVKFTYDQMQKGAYAAYQSYLS